MIYIPMPIVELASVFSLGHAIVLCTTASSLSFVFNVCGHG